MQARMQQNQLSKEECYALIDRCEYGVLASNGPDGYPYGAPVNIVRVGDEICFHGHTKGDKVENLQRDSKVCLTVLWENGYEDLGDDPCNTCTIYESVIVKGDVRRVEDPAEKEAILRALVKRLTPEKGDMPMPEAMLKVTDVYAIGIKDMTGKYHRPEPGNRIMGARPQ